jgi:DNA repair exonuclease SbcCD ATPase subunit
MITFKKIKWKNFLSTGQHFTEIDFQKNNTNLIIGANGAGKSTVLDALTFVLFNKSFRKINKNQLINQTNEKDCLVEIEFSVNSRDYLVRRGIKPNVFEIYVNDDLMNQDAAARDYQKVLEQQILKLNYKTFTQVVILGSASFVPFMQLSTAMRREVIEDILDIRIFSTMNQLLKEKANDTKAEISRIESEITMAKTKVDGQSLLIKTLTDAKSDSIKSLLSKVENNNEQIFTCEGVVASLVTEITALKSRTAEKSKIDSDLETAKEWKTKLTSKVDDWSSHTEFFAENEVCPSCSQGIPHDHKATIVSELQDKIELETKRLDDLNTVLTRLNCELAAINNLVNQITD